MTGIAIVGLGPVGTVTGVAFAAHGHRVRGYDVDPGRRDEIGRGSPPFHEAGLPAALRKASRSGRFSVEDNIAEALESSRIVFLCVGTPPRSDGSMDDGPLRSAVDSLVGAWGDGKRRTIVVKSTVLPGTTDAVVGSRLRDSHRPFRVAVNPEFLREGQAMRDALRPDRIVLGVEDAATGRELRSVYSFARCPILITDLRTAEAIKYATNAFLATKVAFADELANLCEVFGVTYDEVHRGLAMDPRVNPRFLVPGVGPGGSCLPKDVRALVGAAKERGYDARLLASVLAHNDGQYLRAVDLLEKELGGLSGTRIAILGLAFKGGTDDVRESRAIPIARTLLERGAEVVGYDPLAGPNFSRSLPVVRLAATIPEALRGADGCILQADWPEFADLGAEDFLRSMKKPVVVDGRRIVDPKRMKGVRFRRIG